MLPRKRTANKILNQFGLLLDVSAASPLKQYFMGEPVLPGQAFIQPAQPAFLTILLSLNVFARRNAKRTPPFFGDAVVSVLHPTV